LGEDHRNARLMARGLAGIPGIQIDPAKVQTNIVIFDVSGTGLQSAEISARLKDRGVLIDPINATVMRLVTHYDVDREGCEMALDALAEVAAGVGTEAVVR
jgi:threonine aldolase